MYTTSSRIRSKNNAVFATETIEFLLPPANKVWGKVMFSQMFVYPRGGAVGFPACITGQLTGGSASRRVCICGRSASGGLHRGGGVSAFRGVCLWGVSIQGGLHSGVSASGVSASRRWGLHRGFCIRGSWADP